MAPPEARTANLRLAQLNEEVDENLNPSQTLVAQALLAQTLFARPADQPKYRHSRPSQTHASTSSDKQLAEVRDGTVFNLNIDKCKSAGDSSVLKKVSHPTAHICRLPTEILYMILSYFDAFPVAILSLLFVSKFFHALLVGSSPNSPHKQGLAREMKSIDDAWHKRTNAVRNVSSGSLGPQRLWRGCSNWQETYYKVLRKKCISCCRPSSARFGPIWPWGPEWTVMCLPCQRGAFECVPKSEAYAMGLNSADLEKVPFRRSCFGGHEEEYLRGTLMSIAESKEQALQQWKEAYKAKLEISVSSFKGNQERLRYILNDVTTANRQSGIILPAVVRDIVRNPSPTQARLEAMIDLYDKYNDMEEAVKESLMKANIMISAATPALWHVFSETATSKITWLDVLVSGSEKLDVYVDCVRAHTARLPATAELATRFFDEWAREDTEARKTEKI